jgi:hypothetical protein
MWIILAGILATIIFTGGYFANKWEDATSGVNYSHTQQKQALTAFNNYANIAISCTDSGFTTSQIISNQALKTCDNLHNFDSNFRSATLRVDAYQGKQRYIIISWDKLPNNADSDKLINDFYKQYQLKIGVGNQQPISSIDSHQAYFFSSTGGCSIKAIHTLTSDFKALDYTFLNNAICQSLPNNYHIGKYNFVIHLSQ